MAVWLAQQAAADEFQRAGVARAGAAGDDGHPANRPATACRAFSARGTSARSWAAANTSRSRRRYQRADRRSPASSRSTCSKGCCGRCGSWKRAAARSRTSTAAPSGREGNRQSRQLIEEVFEVCDRKWRGIGPIPNERLATAPEYRDSRRRARGSRSRHIETQESTVCISGQILKGLKKPHDCPAFGKECTPHDAAGGDDGFLRRGVRRLLRLRPPSGERSTAMDAPSQLHCRLGNRRMALADERADRDRHR